MTLDPVTADPDAAAFPTLAAPEELAERVSRTHPAVVLPQQLLLSQERAAWLGAKLAEQVGAEGVAGIVGKVYAAAGGDRVEVGEALRALFEAERAERAHAAALAERIARLGMESRDLQGDVARWMAAALRALLAETGLPENDDTRHAVKRAALAGRRAAGMDDGNWDAQVGPRLSAAVRARLLRDAADAAEREAGALAEYPQP